MANRNGLAFISHPAFHEHFAGRGHPERPDRLAAVERALKACGLWDQARHIAPREATDDDFLLCHSPGHIEAVRKACASGMPLEPDTGTSPGSWRAASLAVGAGLVAVDSVLAGESSRVFALVRPPGHHAESERAMGFCLFNNIAIAARYAQRKHDIARVAIVDFDVHHGNGTQEIFYEDGTVMYCSIHQHGPNPLNPLMAFYPGSGGRGETGRGDGAGTNINAPLAAGEGYPEMAAAMKNRLLPALNRFKPQLLFLSAGFDAHADDPLALLRISAEEYGSLTRTLVGIANRHCGGRVISLLEGGYNLEALAESATAHAQALRN